MPAWPSGARKEDKAITGLSSRCHKPVRGLVGLLLFLLCLGWLPLEGWAADQQVEVRRLGLSRVEDQTLLTVVLSRSAEPRLNVVQTPGRPQLLVDFPGARAGSLPTRLEGDDLLVQDVSTAATPAGVRITLDLYPGQPYNYWRRSQVGTGGQRLFILGLKAEGSARSLAELQPPGPSRSESLPLPSPSSPPPPAAGKPGWEPSQPAPRPAEPAPQESRPAAPSGNAVPGSFAELQQLLPSARGLLQSLETNGWTVSESHTYDSPGQRFSRDFVLVHPRYPELSVKIVYLPASSPGTPNIGIVSLTTDNLRGEEAAKYQELRQWNFARIKRDYEDIGDFFEDALKPLRVKLREETKTLVLRDAVVFQTFVRAAAPGSPQLSDQIMAHVKEKVSPRFEGVQYTISENPLIILNQVDFLYVKVFFLDSA
jgi:hypothetical protein